MLEAVGHHDDVEQAIQVREALGKGPLYHGVKHAHRAGGSDGMRIDSPDFGEPGLFQLQAETTFGASDVEGPPACAHMREDERDEIITPLREVTRILVGTHLLLTSQS